MDTAEVIYAPIKRAKAYKNEAERLRVALGLASATILVLTVLVVSLIVALTSQHEKMMYLQNKVDTYKGTVNEYSGIVSDLNCKLTEVTVTANKLTENVNKMADVINELQNSNDVLVANNSNLDSELQVYKCRAELYDKYKYAIYDESGIRTDLTYDDIATGEQLMVSKGLDPDLLFGIIMTESGGIENASSSYSTATGFGQLLTGTAKTIYEQKLGNGSGSYSHSMALDGETNIEITTGYLDYLHNDRNLSIFDTIRQYRGKDDISGYVARIDSYIGTKGKSVSIINSQS